MKISKLTFVALSFSTALHAQGIDSQISNCSANKDNAARLSCYDKIAAAINKSSVGTQSATSSYQAIELPDLKVDIKKLSGKKVYVQGAIQTIGEMSFLKSDEMDMTPIMANIENLPREDRKKLANGCQMLICRGTFFGTVRQNMMGMFLNIDKAEWN